MDTSAHEKWVQERQQQEKAKRATTLARGKEALRLFVLGAIAAWIFHIFGMVMVVPCITLVWLAWVWGRAYPATGTGDVAQAAILYRWSAGRYFRSRTKNAFTYFRRPWLHQWRGSEAIKYFEDHKNIEELANDLPDLDRLGSDEGYAWPTWLRILRWRYGVLLAVGVTANIPVILFTPFWGVLAMLLTGATLYPVARARACGGLPNFMRAYKGLAWYIRDNAAKKDKESALDADQLRAMTTEAHL